MSFNHSFLQKSLAIIALPLLVAGCGGEDSGDSTVQQGHGGKDSKDNIEVVAFGFNTENDKVNYIERSVINIGPRKAKVTEIPIYGKDNYIGDEPTEYLLADSFSFVAPANYRLAADVVVDSELSYHLLWKDKTTGNTLRQDFSYAPVNIAGQSGVSQDTNAETGFNTILNNLPDASSKAFSFPAGSLCYTTNEKVDKLFIEFDEDDVTDYRDLTAWRSGQYSTAVFKNIMLGSNNDIPVSYIIEDIAEGYEDGYESYRGAVQYQGKVYEAFVNPARKWTQNSDPLKGMVYCETYNKVAADYIQSEIKKIYK